MAAAFWSILGVLAGACIALQAPINTQLSRGLGMPVAAAAVSFGVGALVLGVATILLAKFSGQSPQWRVPAFWLFLTGGVLGSFYVTAVILLTPRVGAAAVMALAVSGQLITGLVIDKAGFLGVAVREISIGRIAGVILLITGVVMIRAF